MPSAKAAVFVFVFDEDEDEDVYEDEDEDNEKLTCCQVLKLLELCWRELFTLLASHCCHLD